MSKKWNNLWKNLFLTISTHQGFKKCLAKVREMRKMTDELY